MSKKAIVITFEIDDAKVKEYENFQGMPEYRMPKLGLPLRLILSRIKKEISKFNLSDDILVNMPYDADSIDDWIKMLKIDFKIEDC